MENSIKPLDKINLINFSSIQMKTFHITWITFFFCFFGWFGIAPLMPVVREEFALSKEEIGNLVIASVFATIFARIVFGRLCDSLGPRLSYTILLVLGAIPIIFIGLCNDYLSLLIFRFLIGIIGASFVITQFHTSVMFDSKIVGTANAIAAGWGNLGGGVTNLVMPLIFSAIVSIGFTKFIAWRLAMIIPGIILLVLAYVYYKFTKDTPYGNYKEISKKLYIKRNSKGKLNKAITDYRTWLLAMAYAASFGIEITFDNVAAIYFVDYFKADIVFAGALASIFGIMNLFARALGGIYADKIGSKYGIKGKGIFLGITLILEGLGIILFANTNNLTIAVISMLVFALFLKMANGANYSIVPFINKEAIGSVSGIVAAGGNIGAVLAGFLFKSDSFSYKEAFVFIGITVFIIGLLFMLKFNQTKKEKNILLENLELESVS
ncbi:MAG: NarK family nitrate/nitrite MFS transporter [Melioribacter sp.]|uniref:NarK family nitrate/nitrite MFS transporter n=1 Tax=Rosettibacter primus TaxID=3111523 RepID=UPI00247D371A|nr:NarK family nitrate/nitrite MFS transporter [Melioribacter sp.]